MVASGPCPRVQEGQEGYVVRSWRWVLAQEGPACGLSCKVEGFVARTHSQDLEPVES